MSTNYFQSEVLYGVPGPVKCNKSHDIDGVGFDAISQVTFPAVASVGAGNTATSTSILYLPQACKIVKVGVYCSAIDAVTGDSFNIEVGTGTPLTTVGGADTQRVYGYPTVAAVAGSLVFVADVGFTVANFPNLATGTGGYNVFIPTNWDTIYIPQNGPLNLYTTTTASTGSITNLQVTLTIICIDTNCTYNEHAQPGVSY
jgi:hypothetical protein